MSSGQGVLLGVMAVALVAMAVVQVVALLAAARWAKQAAESMEMLRREVKPLIEKAHRISDDAARAASLAAAQVERVDRLMASATERIDETLSVVQGAVIAPVRQGAALVAAVRAALGVFRTATDRRQQTQDDEEALFVG